MAIMGTECSAVIENDIKWAKTKVGDAIKQDYDRLSN